MALEKMEFVAYSDEEFTSKVSGVNYTVMINPESLKVDRAVKYSDKQALNSSAPSQKYEYTRGSAMNIDLVIDCTGVVDDSRTDLPSEIEKLQKVVYTYNGKIHRPNYVRIIWGKNFSFDGILTSFNITYTLFKPDGTPLRAKVALAFNAYKARETVVKEDEKSSPDMTHMLEVVEGDSLPQLSDKIWGDPSLLIKAAEFNGLNKFRKLKAGSTLIFPPLIADPL